MATASGVPDWQALLAGPLAPYRQRLVPLADPRPSIAGTALLDPATLRERLVLFARNYAAPEPRGVASLWSKHHFSVLIPPALGVALAHGRALPVALDAVAVIAGDDGRTVAFKLDGGEVPASDARDRFTALVDGHLTPLVAALSAVSGLAPRVLWSNAGNVFEFVLRQFQVPSQASGAGGAGLIGNAPADAAALLTSRRRSDGASNPLFEPVRYPVEDGAPRRRRRVCCLRYLIPAQSLCTTCPISERPAWKPA